MTPTRNSCVSLLLLVAASIDSHAAELNVPAGYSTIQSALDAASSGDTVKVASGLYIENLVIQKSVELIGAGSSRTILDGGFVTNVITVSGPPSIDLVIDGFRVQNSSQNFSSLHDSGLLVNGSSCCSQLSQVLVRNCHFEGNGAGIKVALLNGVVTAERCVFARNQIGGVGGFGTFTTVIRQCTLVENGVAITSTGGPMVIEGNIISFNMFGVYLLGAAPSLSISYNDTFGNSGGDYVDGSTFLPFPPTPGTGEISVPPLFIGLVGSSDVHLNAASPCIDAGNPATTDPDGSIADIGAYAFDASYVAPLAETYGQACGGLTMSAENMPVLSSNTFRIGLSGAAPGSAALLLLGISDQIWNGVPLPLDLTPSAPGCELLLAPNLNLLLFFPVDASGALSLPIPIPDLPAAYGIDVFAQWVGDAGAANPLNVFLTDGLHFVIGG